eukprot:Selendium_serpulae@DN5032_c0_g1_i1.p1
MCSRAFDVSFVFAPSIFFVRQHFMKWPFFRHLLHSLSNAGHFVLSLNECNVSHFVCVNVFFCFRFGSMNMFNCSLSCLLLFPFWINEHVQLFPELSSFVSVL